MAKIIVIEGRDSLGKTAQVQRLRNTLVTFGKKCVVVKSPYNDGLTYRLIYWMLRTGWARKLPNLFQVIHFVNKVYFQTFKLPKLLQRNDYVILDRWVASMWAYGLADKANQVFTTFLVRLIKEPDVTIVMFGRPFDRQQEKDSYEADNKYQNVVQSYYRVWVKEHKRCFVVDANQDIEVVSRKIFNRILGE